MSEMQFDRLLAGVAPELHDAAIALIRQRSAYFPLTIDTLPGLRDDLAIPASEPLPDIASEPLPDIAWEWRQIPGLAGSPPVDALLINAAGERGRSPAICHMHGGGMVAGSARSSLASLQKLAGVLDCVVLSIEYRLAPETRGPGILADVYAGLAWLHRTADELGVDRARIGVMGESAGGGLASLLAISARNQGEFAVAFQCLTYPMLDDRTGSGVIAPSRCGLFGWTAIENRFGWHASRFGPGG